MFSKPLPTLCSNLTWLGWDTVAAENASMHVTPRPQYLASRDLSCWRGPPCRSIGSTPGSTVMNLRYVTLDSCMSIIFG